VKRLAIIGGGAWGTALAGVSRRAGSQAILWARDPAIVAAINERHENPVFLPGLAIDPAIRATNALAAALDGVDAALLVVPAQFLRGVLAQMVPLMPARLPLLICAKGIETGSLLTMGELVRAMQPAAPLAVLSGPSFAAEVARALPTAVTIASHDPALAGAFAASLASSRFRPYLSSDPVGAEIGGAVKNVLAIACGIIEGRGLGDNAGAALITRGLAEMIRLGVAKGARAETFAGLSGLGDLVLTCTSGQSRNFSFGFALGRGKDIAAARAEGHTTEGVFTAGVLVDLAHRKGIDMPISEAVDAVLAERISIDAAIEALLARPLKSELTQALSNEG
jgi:glycerol-3-phosphate dehydrogenase (NAD(P)+)